MTSESVLVDLHVTSESVLVEVNDNMTADGRLVCGFGDDHASLPKTESCSLNPEVCDLESLHFNGDKLLWSNDLELRKNFAWWKNQLIQKF